MNCTFNLRHKLILSLMVILMATSAQAIETPQYTVIYEDETVEYRQYDPYIVAETFVDKSVKYKKASNEGFMRLFRYITGNNNTQADIDMTAPVQLVAASEEIAMTAPVQRVETEDSWRISFMLPSKYSMETAPTPGDERISLRLVSGQLMAVVRYSGRWTERNYDKHKERLSESLDAAAVETIGAFESAAYDAPYVLPFLRRNEVMVEVKSIPVTQLTAATGS
jgi:hypothetical protein